MEGKDVTIPDVTPSIRAIEGMYQKVQREETNIVYHELACHFEFPEQGE